MRVLDGLESGGAFADKWDYFPDPYDPIYPWSTANPSVIRTSVIFWSLAELEADRHAASLAHRGDDSSGEGGSDGDRDAAIRSAGGPSALTDASVPRAAPHAAAGEMYTADTLMLAVVMGHELGAPSLPGSGSSEDQDPLRDPSRRGAAPAAGLSAHPSATGSPALQQEREALGGSSERVSAFATRLERVSPNPSRRGCQIAWSLARAGEAGLEIFDVTGRRVGVLQSGFATAGAHVASWDGREASGARAGPGLYFATLTTASGRTSLRFVVAP
jgi:hypothetical protein